MALNQLDTKRLIIQNLTEMDYDFLQAIYEDKKNYEFATGNFTNSVPNFHDLQVDLTNNSEQFFFIAKKRKTEQAIGCIKGQIRSKEGAIWISMLLVVTSEQRKGYGKEILECFCGYWKTYFDSKTIFISVDDENKNGLAFWYNMGFKLKQARYKSKNGENSSGSGVWQILILDKDLK